MCGYEVGCLGYTLYHELSAKGYKCVILAPTTMPSTAKEIKTDKLTRSVDYAIEPVLLMVADDASGFLCTAQWTGIAI